MLGFRDARDRADLPPDLRGRRGDVDAAGHGPELVRAGAEGLERPGDEGQERDGGDAEPAPAVGLDLGTGETGHHPAERGHEQDDRQGHDDADPAFQLQGDGAEGHDHGRNPRAEEHPRPPALPALEPDHDETEGGGHEEQEADRHDAEQRHPGPAERLADPLVGAMEEHPAEQAVEDAEADAEVHLLAQGEAAFAHGWELSSPARDRGKPACGQVGGGPPIIPFPCPPRPP